LIPTEPAFSNLVGIGDLGLGIGRPFFQCRATSVLG
jgi:hypothetical protein